MGIFFSLYCRLREKQPFKKDLRVLLFNNKDLAQVEFCRTSEQTGRTTLCKLHLKIPTQSTDHTVSFFCQSFGAWEFKQIRAPVNCKTNLIL